MSPDLGRLDRCLTRLVLGFGSESFVLTGGIAVDYHLAAAGRRGLRDSVADVDLVTARPERFAMDRARDLLVSHFHVPGAGVPKALLQLVDPDTRLRIDVFPDLDDALASARPGRVGETLLPILGAEAILAHKLLTLERSSASDPADAKHFRDAVALAALCGRAAPQPPLHVTSTTTYAVDVTMTCQRCARSRTPRFPIAPKTVLFEILGHV